MRKLLIAMCAFVLAFATCEANAPLIAEIARPAVVTIHTAKASGSGFFVSSQGYIVTNRHVVAGNNDVTVVAQNGKKIPGKVVAVGQEDVALIRIMQENMPTLRIGSGHNAKVGEDLVWFGSPHGLSDTTTKGSLANNNRTINGARNLQLNGYVIPGNSGGPVLNMKGEVIGIVTAKSAESDGIGYALPIETVYKLLVENGVPVNVSADITELSFRDVNTGSDKAMPNKNRSENNGQENLGIYKKIIVGVIILIVVTGIYWFNKKRAAKKRIVITDVPVEPINILLKAKNNTKKM